MWRKSKLQKIWLHIRSQKNKRQTKIWRLLKKFLHSNKMFLHRLHFLLKILKIKSSVTKNKAYLLKMSLKKRLTKRLLSINHLLMKILKLNLLSRNQQVSQRLTLLSQKRKKHLSINKSKNKLEHGMILMKLTLTISILDLTQTKPLRNMIQ